MTMTYLVGTYPSSYFFPFPLLFFFAATLPVSLVHGLQVTSSENNLTSRLTPDESVVPSQISHPSRVRSWGKNVTVLPKEEDEQRVSQFRSNTDIKVTHPIRGSISRSIVTPGDSLASSSLTPDLPGHENSKLPNQEAGSEADILDYRYRTSEHVSSTKLDEGGQSDVPGKEKQDHNLSALVERSQVSITQNVMASNLRVQLQAILHGPRWTAKETLFVELVAIGDYSFCQHHGANAVERINQVVGVANMLYAPLGIVIVLADVHLWSSRDLAQVYSSKERTLVSIQTYREKMIKENPSGAFDNLMLITRGLEFGAGGVAATGAMCYGHHSVNIVQDVNGHAGIVGTILAHEIGHNFGMKHDGEGDNFPSIGNCMSADSIMASSVDVQNFDPNSKWSACSREYISKMLKTSNLDCLKNIPKTTYGSNCGNGIVEYGEECDCGIPELCKNKCCDPITCKLAPQATCASGACCNTATCKPHPVATVCREARDDCDLPEYCSGKDELCPSDVQRGDGVDCSYGQGHCYKGVCGSHSKRCQQLWGYQASVASQQCYQNLTHRGDRAGNCGGYQENRNQYIYCDKDASNCGTLYCNAHGNNKVELSSRTNHHTGSQWVGSSLCQYVEGYPSHYPSADWLAPDGSNCGTRKMCVNQKCISVRGTDNGLNCPNKCSGRGICNSRGNCHCDPGYAPPDCAKPGPGGSYDSGQTPAPRGGLVALWIILILILIVVICILCCFWNKIRMWWEMTGRGRISPVAPRVALCIDDCFCSAVSKAVHYLVSSGPLGRVKNPFQKKDSESGRTSKKTKGYRVDVKVKRHSQPDYLDTDDQIAKKSKHSRQNMMSRPAALNNIPSETTTRPKYQQSISIDSGCVIEDELRESPSTDMSMSSLLNVFKSYTTKTESGLNRKENLKLARQDHHKEVSLRRLVTDPNAGNRGEKKSLPQPYQNPPLARHSISVDITIGNKSMTVVDKSVTQVDHTICKSHDDLLNAPKLANNHFIFSNSKKSISNQFHQVEKQVPSVHILTKTKHDTAEPSVERPLMPPRKSRTPPRVSPPRGPPPLPPVKEIVQEVAEVKILKTKNKGTKIINRTDKESSLTNGKLNGKPHSSLNKESSVKVTTNITVCNSRPKPSSGKDIQGSGKMNKSTCPRASGTKNVMSIAKKFEKL